MVTVPDYSADQSQNPSRVTADTPAGIADLLRPDLGYATQIWAPQSIELIVKLERVQRRTTEFMLKLPFNISYKSRFQTLNLIPFCYWHELLDLTLFFKLTHGLERELLCPT